MDKEGRYTRRALNAAWKIAAIFDGETASAADLARIISSETHDQEMAHLIREALPQLRWGNVHGSRCDELIAEAEALLTKIGETP